MAGTVDGGKRASRTNKQLYGEDFYRTIGKRGGELSRGGGFAFGEQGQELAREAGRKGGKISSRRKYGHNNNS